MHFHVVSGGALPWLLILFATLACARAQESDVTDHLLLLSNEVRAAEDLPALTEDAGLAQAARKHAEELARRGVLSHESEQADLRTPAQRVARAGVALVEVAENVAMIEGPDVAERTVEGWLESPGHRENLLDPDYDQVGHGVAEGSDATYVVQVLGARPITRVEAFAVAEDGGGEVTLELRYAEEDPSLVLFVDGRHQRGAEVEPGVLRTTVAAPDEPVPVSVGMHEGDDSVRIVEAFELRPGAPPSLVPGAPEVAANGPSDGE